jgi:hypothetical protein
MHETLWRIAEKGDYKSAQPVIQTGPRLGVQGWDTTMNIFKTTLPFIVACGVAHAEETYVYEHHGLQGKVVEETGTGTADARMSLLIDDNGAKLIHAHANCMTGAITGFLEKTERIYVGQVEAGEGNDKYMTHVITDNGFRIPDAGYTGVWEDGALFRRMCPTSFTEPPKVMPREWSYSSDDCGRAVKDAERIVVESGVRHVMNVKVINEWDVKPGGDYATEVNCSARVRLNTGAEMTLNYKIVADHGKAMIRARLD